jgi:hypothetical protein
MSASGGGGEHGTCAIRLALAHLVIHRHSKECRPHFVTLHRSLRCEYSLARRAIPVIGAHPGATVPSGKRTGTYLSVVVVVGEVVVVEDVGLVVVVVGVVKMCLRRNGPIGWATR